MAASRLRDTAQAQRWQQQLQALVALDATAQQQARWLGIEIALAANDLVRAQALMPPAAASQAASPQRPALLLQAQTALQTADKTALAQSAQNLQSWVAQQPRDALGVFGAQVVLHGRRMPP